MNRLFCVLVLLVSAAGAKGQTPKPAATAAPKPSFRLQYDHKALRIPGNKFAVTLVTADKKQEDLGHYHVEVDSGSYSRGNVTLKKSTIYKKGDSVTVSVYNRKWFLGGKGKFLIARKIPYNYEDSIVVLSNGNTDLSPGDHLKFGIRTIYNNKQFSEVWYPVKKKAGAAFLLQFDGSHLSKKKGDWMIDTDPTLIRNDRVKLVARLAKAPAISDSLQLQLDYKASFRSVISSTGDGHELDVFADVYNDSTIHAQLLKVEVHDSTTHRVYHYLVNTAGGSLSLTSQGAAGADGANGLDGLSGSDGSDGITTETPETSTDADGNTTTTYTTDQGAGGNGSDGQPGDDGKDGDNGFDGGNIYIHSTLLAASYVHLITATSVPGAGGSGGRGGTGGSGGNGGSGNPPGSPGSKGLDGRDGYNGNPGKPGKVVYISPS